MMRDRLLLSSLLCLTGLVATATNALASTTTRALSAPAVLRAPAPFGAAAPSDTRLIPQGQFVVPAHTVGERSSLLDAVTRERYQEAMALQAARGAGVRIVFKKARY